MNRLQTTMSSKTLAASRGGKPSKAGVVPPALEASQRRGGEGGGAGSRRSATHDASPWVGAGGGGGQDGSASGRGVGWGRAGKQLLQLLGLGHRFQEIGCNQF